MKGFAIRGHGVALPEGRVTSAEIARRVHTSEAWILERTGIRERRVGGTTAELAAGAARAALASAGVGARDVDLLLLATTTPDRTVPATAPAVQERLGLVCGAFDLNAACSGFVYALVAANGFLRQGLERILVVGAETLSRIVDGDDRDTAILFGDGAGAVLVEAREGDAGILGFDLHSDGSAGELLYADVGGTIAMRGREVFRQAVHVMVESSTRALERAGVKAADIALLVPHQANARILATCCERLGIPLERTALALELTGNVSAASVPLALSAALDAGRVARGDLVLFAGFGAGMTAASAVVRWG